MTKGGAREPSDIMPVGKGMGLTQHYETLKMIKELTSTDTRTLMTELNKKFAWWDDPKNGAPTETCRSYTKELWRLGLITRYDKNNAKIELNVKNWSNGFSKSTSRLSQMGDFIMTQNKRQFPYYVAWCIVHAVKNEMYSQCSKLFKLYDIKNNIPTNDEETAKQSEELGMYVEKHGGKAIKYGWLEPTGLIYRASQQYFKVNTKFIKYLKSIEYKKIFTNTETQIVDERFTVTLDKPYLGYSSFERHSTINFSFEFINKSQEIISIDVDGSLSSVFEHIAELHVSDDHININANDKKTIEVQITSKRHEFSDSFGMIFCGFLKVTVNEKIWNLYFPSIILAKKDRVWEMEVLDKFKKLGFKTFHVGRSDRPDGVIDLSGITSEPDDLLEYLRDSTKEKMLMETTIGEYSYAKRRMDTQRIGDRIAKYVRHTTAVLKIQAVGQLLTASKFNDDIILYIQDPDQTHPITLIDMEHLDYLISKHNEIGNGKKAIIKILKSNAIVTKTDINSAFEEL